jgi:hypothetical protein
LPRTQVVGRSSAFEQRERLGRPRPRDDVAADDDRVHVRASHVGEHRLERGQVAVHVVEGRDVQRRSS